MNLRATAIAVALMLGAAALPAAALADLYINVGPGLKVVRPAPGCRPYGARSIVCANRTNGSNTLIYTGRLPHECDVGYDDNHARWNIDINNKKGANCTFHWGNSNTVDITAGQPK